MSAEWPVAKFGDLYSIPSRNGVNYPTRTRGSGTPMVNMRELFAYDQIKDQEMELVPLTPRQNADFILGEGDLLFARQSLVLEGAGRVVYVCAGPRRTWDGHIIRVRLDSQVADSRFFYYFFRSSEGRSRVETIVEQVAVAGIRSSDLGNLRVPVPPIVEQRAIAEVLRALDDKLDANRVLQYSAEQLARAEVLRSQESAVRSIPIAELVERISDLCQPKDLGPDDRFVGLEHLPRGSLLLKAHGSAEGLVSAKTRFQPRDVLFGKLRPYFKKVAIAPHSGVCSTDILVFRPRGSWAFAAAVLASDAVIDYASAGGEGTRMPRVSPDYLMRFEVPLPSADVVKEVHATTAPLLELGIRLSDESDVLIALRDALLPRLLSGELRVREAQQLVSDVA